FMVMFLSGLLVPTMFLPLMLGVLLQVILGEHVLQGEEHVAAKNHAEQVEADFINDIKHDKLNAIKLVKYLEMGINIHKLNSCNYSALDIAAKFAVINQINLLTPHMKQDLLSAVYTAIHHYEMELLNLLLSKVEDVDFNYAYTPLIVAIERRRPDMVNALLQKGAKVTDLVIEAAKRYENAEVTRLLENAQKKTKATQTKVAKTSNATKQPATVVPLFDAKRKASKTQPEKSVARKPAAKAVNQRKKSLRSYQK
ncbi:MAG TPA: ankyrin repeat domain-containing protein, partial [Candidatus Berkiella sp.]|nr:ankyrin repeat domain-containing protein [Candidatus Berkiella sp.]